MLKLLTIISYLIITTACSSCGIAKGPTIAPNTKAQAINQIYIHTKGCGPTSLINSYRFGSEKWNNATKKITGKTDKEQFNFLIRKYGKVFSSYVYLSRRWNPRSGINIIDLVALANDFQKKRGLKLPKLKLTTHFVKSKGHKTLLKDTHKHWIKSFKNGFPPIISIQRLSNKGNRWKKLHGHFVTVYEIPSSLPSDADSFVIKYIDPWGGTIKTGTIKVPQKAFFAINIMSNKPKIRKSPTLTIDFPQSSLGKRLLKKNERSATILSGSITPK